MSEKIKIFMLEYPLAKIKENPFELVEAYGYLKALTNTTEDEREVTLCHKLRNILLTEMTKLVLGKEI